MDKFNSTKPKFPLVSHYMLRVPTRYFLFLLFCKLLWILIPTKILSQSWGTIQNSFFIVRWHMNHKQMTMWIILYIYNTRKEHSNDPNSAQLIMSLTKTVKKKIVKEINWGTVCSKAQIDVIAACFVEKNQKQKVEWHLPLGQFFVFNLL